MVVTDLDGTLLDSQHRLSETDRQTLESLGRLGVTRVVATGRSLFAARKVLGDDTPIDFLAHTSGAGIVSWPDQAHLKVHHMDLGAAASLAAKLVQLRVDFMLHHGIPDNHRFFIHRCTPQNDDFERRVALYSEHATDLRLPLSGPARMGHAVVIEPASGEGRHAELQQALLEFQVIRATSPLDGRSTWYEIFPHGVAKSAASAWLRARVRRGLELSVAVGNDYNDRDLLQWADLPFVVANAPAELRLRYPSVASNEASGFTEAVRRALASATSSL